MKVFATELYKINTQVISRNVRDGSKKRASLFSNALYY